MVLAGYRLFLSDFGAAAAIPTTAARCCSGWASPSSPPRARRQALLPRSASCRRRGLPSSLSPFLLGPLRRALLARGVDLPARARLKVVATTWAHATLHHRPHELPLCHAAAPLVVHLQTGRRLLRAVQPHSPTHHTVDLVLSCLLVRFRQLLGRIVLGARLVLLVCSLLEQPPRQFGTAAATRQYGLSWPAPLLAARSADLLRCSKRRGACLPYGAPYPLNCEARSWLARRCSGRSMSSIMEEGG